VNKTGSGVECEKSKQPKNDQNRGNDSKHDSLLASEREKIRGLIVPKRIDALLV
jgi:hypothetical protein